jgi:hypothetical protein
MNTIIAVDLTTIIHPAIMGIISLIIVAMIGTVDTIPMGITISTVDIAVQLPATMTAMVIGTVTLTSPMKWTFSLAMLVAIGTAGCHDHHYRGGSYDEYLAGYYGYDQYVPYSS